MNTIRKLKASEIEVRVQSVVAKNDEAGAVLLLYKNARVDMAILDETYGPLNWNRKHTLIDGQLYCTVGIFDETKGIFVEKQDVGLAANGTSDMAEKARASDGFKRACTCLGIGRELYTAPFTYVNLKQDEWYVDNAGKAKVKPAAKFCVSQIEYDEDVISELKIVDKNGIVRFSWTKGDTNYQTSNSVAPKPAKETTEPTQEVQKTCVCSECGSRITEKSRTYSIKVFGRELCYKCQRQCAQDGDLMDSRTHMYKDQLRVTNKYCERLLAHETDKTETVIRCLSCVIASRMRMFVRDMNQTNIYNMLAELPSLKKFKAAERKQIAQAVKVFTECQRKGDVNIHPIYWLGFAITSALIGAAVGGGSCNSNNKTTYVRNYNNSRRNKWRRRRKNNNYNK